VELLQLNRVLATIAGIIFIVDAADEIESRYCASCRRKVNIALGGMTIFVAVAIAAIGFTIYILGLEQIEG